VIETVHTAANARQYNTDDWCRLYYKFDKRLHFVGELDPTATVNAEVRLALIELSLIKIIVLHNYYKPKPAILLLTVLSHQ